MTKSKKEITTISQEKVEATIAQVAGISRLEQTAFTRLSGPGNLSVYVARTKRIGRAYLCGFTIGHPAALPISEQEAKELKLGRVRGQLDFSRPEEEVLDALQIALFQVASAEPKATKAAKEPKAPKQPKLQRAAKKAPEPTEEPAAATEDDGQADLGPEPDGGGF